MKLKAAAYARYSTKDQDSLDGQYSECDKLAATHGFDIVARFEDRAISGGTAQRPGYRAMMEAARRGEFTVVLAADLDRLWRNPLEQSRIVAEFADADLHIVCGNVDSRQKSSGVMFGVLGAINSESRAVTGDKTHVGLEEKFKQGYWTGGKPFGYLFERIYKPGGRINAYGEREADGTLIHVDPEKAKIVKEVFEAYADGASALSIAKDLNKRGVPSPGSHWKNRKVRRKSGWMPTAIAGDPAKGTGLLNNILYTGTVVWNRVHWKRSAQDSADRDPRPRAAADWLTRQDEALRIIPQDLWDRVKARQRQQSETVGGPIRTALRMSRNGELLDTPEVIRRGSGRGPKHLLSGFLKCPLCSSSYVSNGASNYACASNRSGACSNNVQVKRDPAQAAIASYVTDVLLAPANVAKLAAYANEALTERQRASAGRHPELQATCAELAAKVANLVSAITNGDLRQSPALAAALTEAEAKFHAAKDELAAATPAASASRLIPRLAERTRTILTNWQREAEAGRDSGGIEVAQGALRSVLGGHFMVEGEPIPGSTKLRPVGVLQEPGMGLLRAAVGSRFTLTEITENFGSGGRI